MDPEDQAILLCLDSSDSRDVHRTRGKSSFDDGGLDTGQIKAGFLCVVEVDLAFFQVRFN